MKVKKKALLSVRAGEERERGIRQESSRVLHKWPG